MSFTQIHMPLQVSYQTKWRGDIYRKLAQSALRSSSAFVLACGLFAVTCSWLLRTADGLSRVLQV